MTRRQKDPLRPLTDAVGQLGGVGDAVSGVLAQIRGILG